MSVYELQLASVLLTQSNLNTIISDFPSSIFCLFQFSFNLLNVAEERLHRSWESWLQYLCHSSWLWPFNCFSLQKDVQQNSSLSLVTISPSFWDIILPMYIYSNLFLQFSHLLGCKVPMSVHRSVFVTFENYYKFPLRQSSTWCYALLYF